MASCMASAWSFGPQPLLNLISLRADNNPRDYPKSKTCQTVLSGTFQKWPLSSGEESWEWKRNNQRIYAEVLQTGCYWTPASIFLCNIWRRRNNNLLHSESSSLFPFHLHRILQNFWLHLAIFCRNILSSCTLPYKMYIAVLFLKFPFCAWPFSFATCNNANVLPIEDAYAWEKKHILWHRYLIYSKKFALIYSLIYSNNHKCFVMFY